MKTSRISEQTVLVTGGTGFIGSHLCRVLGDRGYKVHSVSRGTEPHENGNVRWWKGDLTDTATARRILGTVRPGLIFHLASHVAGARDLAYVMPTFRNNLVSTINLLTAAAEVKCGRVVLTGSLEEPEPGPSNTVPCSPYAASKWAASAYARMFHALYGVPVVISRLFMVYGPGQADHRKLIPYVILSLLRKDVPKLTSGLRLVDWIFVEDVVEGLLAVAKTPGLEGKTIDIGSGKLVAVREVVDHLTELIDPNIRPMYGALVDRRLEQVRAANVPESQILTGWAPRTSLTEGLKRTSSWYAQQLENGLLIGC